MTNLHQSISELFTAIANSIRGITKNEDLIIADEFPTIIQTQLGPALPKLTSPATENDILLGKESINENGEKIIGKIVQEIDTGEDGLLQQLLQRNVSVNQFHDKLLTTLSTYVFSGLNYNSNEPIEFAEFDNVFLIRNYAFDTANILRCKFNRAVLLGGNAFRKASNIELLDFNQITFTGTLNFVFCNKLKTLIIRSENYIPLYSYDSISTGGIGDDANLYFPPNLLEEYKTGTNWSIWADSMHPFYIANTIEDIQSLLNDENIPINSLIICDSAEINNKYTIKSSI